MHTQSILRVPFVDLAAQREPIAQQIEEAIFAVLDRGDFILGHDVTRFEAEFADFCGVEHAIGVDSGTSALKLALEAIGIGAGDAVITAANTFIATALAITQVGASPVLIDVDPEYYTLNPAEIEAAITPHTRAIIPVHLYGQPADMEPIQAIAQHHGLAIIEDACQAHGAYYRNQRAGSLGHVAAFSFYPAKNLGAYGDAGIVVTRDAEIAKRLRMLRDYGQT
ncbi:MAG: DegT/DnrJ/EryC1/StrS family aminotransferase, partial [Chloroflexi bacterium]|nr:DegT/DnrJ/EryC1/StrS family aminotransferase [Chloroflexota bacterium]